MNIIHFSDTHLGFSDLDIINDEGINQRESDVYDAFSQVIDDILKQKPNYVIHCGDLFYTSNPSNRAIAFCQEQLKRLESFKIPFIVIAGNRSTSKSFNNSVILKALKTLKYVYPVFEQKYEKIEFEDIIFHALPHINDKTKIDNELELIEQNIMPKKKNVMILHCSVGVRYSAKEFGEWNYPKEKEYLFDKMDYVALGHWFGFQQLNKKLSHVCYSGSTQRTKSIDKSNDKGYVNIKLKTGSKIEFRKINTRKSYLLEIDCLNFDDSLQRAIEESNKFQLENSLLEIELINLTTSKSIDLPSDFFDSYFTDVMHLSIKREFLQKEQTIFDEVINTVSLKDYFIEHLELNIEDKSELSRLEKKVQKLFNEDEKSFNETL